ncbi:Polyketide cyclase / dehydrase and lipid transport [Streptomyces sp. DvalAA-14]|uniref:SRPBCC family protein n=1 Tax=unclassified Streptomyces TaxID=2593676 RepID=UPI00081B3CA2|nr:SRPBCC family protein [Streptomyces sp. DvalAA-14]MYS21828.1 SRPBCC family protein [Streptomyces sp. SID4948]SCE01963.1 Polyketide cyclase / dehydrase and lipid transport [Streptomyces sp. DvalAA-14]
MPRRQTVDVSVPTAAGPDAVYALVTEGATWPVWAGVRAFTLERPGDVEREGVGAIRVFRVGPVASRVQVTECVPASRYSYRLLSGLPVRDYRGTGTFRPGRVRWQLSFTAAVPGTGWWLRRYMRRFVTRFAQGLASYAEQYAEHAEHTAEHGEPPAPAPIQPGP